MTRLQGEVTRLQGEVREREGRVTRLQGEVTRLQGEVTGFQDNLRARDVTVSGLRDQLAGQREHHVTELCQVRQEAEQQLREEQAQCQQLAARIDTVVGLPEGRSSVCTSTEAVGTAS